MARNRVLETIQDDFGNAIGGADVIVTAYRKGTDTVRTRYIAATGADTAANAGRASPGLDTELTAQAAPAADELTVATTDGWAIGDVVHIRSGDNVARRVVKAIPSGTVLALDATIGGAFTYPVGSTVRSPVGSWQGFFDDAHDTEIEVENDATGEFSGRKQWRTGTVGGIQPTLLDAKGDLIVASADNTPARLAVGADGTIPHAASGEPTGLKYQKPDLSILDRIAATTTVVNTSAETDLYAKTIAADALGTTGGLRLRLNGDYLNDTAGQQQMVIRVKFGATTLFGFTASGGVNASADRRAWQLDVFILNTSAIAQRAGAIFDIHAATASTGRFLIQSTAGAGDHYSAVGYNTAAEDTSAAKDLVVTVAFLNASASLDIRLQTGVLELLKAA